MTTRLDEIRERCNTFHRAHPEVWELFKHFTLERIRAGFKHYSADAIFHRVRWEMARPTYRPGEDFKVNNDFTAFYGRRFMQEHPEHEGFFRTRTQTSGARAATHLPELGPRDYE